MSCSTSPSAMALVASAMISHDAHAVQRHHHLKGAGVEKIAHQDAGLVAEDLVGGVAAAAQRRAVDHVVVQQGGGMDEFDDGGGLDVRARRMAAGAGGEQHQEGAQALAAGIDNVGRDLVDQRHWLCKRCLTTCRRPRNRAVTNPRICSSVMRAEPMVRIVSRGSHDCGRAGYAYSAAVAPRLKCRFDPRAGASTIRGSFAAPCLGRCSRSSEQCMP